MIIIHLDCFLQPWIFQLKVSGGVTLGLTLTVLPEMTLEPYLFVSLHSVTLVRMGALLLNLYHPIM